MARTKFAQKLFDEFESRQLRNSRYSLRAFAKFLKTDHSSLAQILRGTRHVPAKHIREWSAALQLDAEESMVYSAMEIMPNSELAARHERLKHWTAEASAITANKLHWQILQLSRERDFRPDTRWIAKRTGCNVDEVNIALARLLRLRLLTLDRKRWTELAGAAQSTEKEFRRMVLARIREELAGPNEQPNTR
jgi:transcriptional regulator with XRE-family HTH domain